MAGSVLSRFIGSDIEFGGARIMATAIGAEGQETRLDGEFDRQGVAVTGDFACS